MLLSERFFYWITSEFLPQIEYPVATLCRKNFHINHLEFLQRYCEENRLKFICWPLGFASRLFSLSQGCFLTHTWRKILGILRPSRTLCRGRLSQAGTVFYWLLMNESELSDCLKGVDDETKSHRIALRGSLCDAINKESRRKSFGNFSFGSWFIVHNKTKINVCVCQRLEMRDDGSVLILAKKDGRKLWVLGQLAFHPDYLTLKNIY